MHWQLFKLAPFWKVKEDPGDEVVRVPAVPMSLVSVVAKQREAYLVEVLAGFLAYFGIKRLKS